MSNVLTDSLHRCLGAAVGALVLVAVPGIATAGSGDRIGVPVTHAGTVVVPIDLNDEASVTSGSGVGEKAGTLTPEDPAAVQDTKSTPSPELGTEASEEPGPSEEPDVDPVSTPSPEVEPSDSALAGAPAGEIPAAPAETSAPETSPEVLPEILADPAPSDSTTEAED